MAVDEPKVETPIGQVLFENLTKALIDNTNAQIVAARMNKDLLDEIRLLREDIDAAGGMTEDLCTHLATYLRVLDHVAMSSAERPPKWKDVQDVLQEIKDELQEEEERAEREEREQQEGDGKPGQELFPPRKKTS